ncbi:MAG: hypothetical protein IKP73_13765 [Bacteroidales bacterium]|nr:hypothetical protein [Bacteroidales bacterium]
MKRKHLIIMLLALLGITTFSQGCSKDDDDGGTEVVNGGSNNNGDNTGTNNGGSASNDDKPTNGDGTNNGGETKTDLTTLDWKVEWDYISDDFFPSWTYMQLKNKQFAEMPECVSISIPKESEGARIKLTFEGNKFMDQTVVEETVTADMIKKESYSPKKLKWKEDALVNASTPGFFNLNAVLEINGKVVQRFNQRVNYHSINECVFKVVGPNIDNGDLSPLFSTYVNEDNPNIEKILTQCEALGENRRFIGNQGTKDDVLNQMWWVWQYFSMRGTKYSSITTNSSNVVESADGTKIYNQSVRFFDQCYNEKGANCVDGSCMLASIYRKIDFDVALVLVPGHCFLAVRPQTNDVKGKEDENIIFLETTLMDNTQINGVQYNPNNADDNRKLFDFAIDYAEYEVEDNANKHGIDEVKGVYIANARAQGFKPIQHTQAINVEVIAPPTDFTPSVDIVSFNKSEHKYIGYYYNENDATDNTDYDYRYTIGFTLTYPNVESTKETGFIMGDYYYMASNGTIGQGCRMSWQKPQSTSSGTLYYYSNSTSATVYVQGYCIDDYGVYRWSSPKQVNCVYSSLGTK